MTMFAILINTSVRAPNPTAIEGALSGEDWLRFAGNQYFVRSALTVRQIYDRIKAVLGSEDLLMVIPVTPAERLGWTSQVAIDWFNKPDLTSLKALGLR